MKYQANLDETTARESKRQLPGPLECAGCDARHDRFVKAVQALAELFVAQSALPDDTMRHDEHDEHKELVDGYVLNRGRW